MFKGNLLLMFAVCMLVQTSFAVDGNLDTTFNPSGVFPGVPGAESIPDSNFGAGATDCEAKGVAVQSDGKIVCGGFANPTGALVGGGTSSFAVARFTITGALDSGFHDSSTYSPVAGIETIYTLSFGTGNSIAQASTLALQADVVTQDYDENIPGYYVSPSKHPSHHQRHKIGSSQRAVEMRNKKTGPTSKGNK